MAVRNQFGYLDSVYLSTVTIIIMMMPAVAYGQAGFIATQSMFEREYIDTHPLIISGDFKRRYASSNLDFAMQKPDIEGVLVHIRLPAGYSDDKRYPLLLYLKWPDVPAPIHALFDHHGIVFAAVMNTDTRIGSYDWVQKNAQFALNAAHNIAQEFSINPHRVYVGGVSGGAASAINVAPLFPDVFRGGLFFSSGGDLDFDSVESSFLDTAKSTGRYFFATGDKDRSQGEVLAQYRSFEASGFRNLLLINETEIGHDTPPAVYFERGWAFLEGDGSGSPPGAANVSALERTRFHLRSLFNHWP